VEYFIFNCDYVYFLTVPVVTYLNSDTDKLLILKENKGKTGIYKWTNLKNNNCYIGSSTNLSVRISRYYNLNILIKYGQNSLINKALLKYGYSKFKVEILEYCDRSDLIKREQYYIDLLKPEYNILQKAGSSLGYKHTKESLAKISRTSAGRTLNEETRAKMSAALKGEQNPMFGKKGEMHPRFSKKHSEKTRAKMSSSKGIAINVLDVKTNITTKYLSGNQAAKAISCSPTTLQKYLKSGKILKNRYILSKVMV